jgi:hypothetical protein
VKTAELSLRTQTLLNILQEVLVDLAFELRRDYDDVDIRVSISAK